MDNTLVLISAGNTGGSILAAVIAITGVLNTSLLSFFERIREFGVLRSIGWTRRRIVSLVLGESLIVSLVGATIGVFLGWVAINLLQNLPELRGCFPPDLHGFDLHQVAGVRHRRGFPRSDLPCASSCVPLSGGGDAS
ncbi:MAG: ABC transporter permease [Candidatus Microthrix sp.]|nr:ABC transporter permease [Candidatus Microthrix sp.]MBK6439536.1 ABC transporter permease [Candidatus Microthrix sp.]